MIHYLAQILPSSSQLTSYGQMGDYVGGVWGTAISLITLIVVYFTWQATRKATRLESITTVLTEMLQTHDNIVSNGHHSFWDREGTPSVALREFSAIYKQTKRSVPSDQEWSIDDRIDIAYTFVFYGLSTQARHSLSKYDDNKLKTVQDAISKIRLKGGGRYADMFKGHQATLSHYIRNVFGMYTLIDESKIPNSAKMNLSKIVRTKLSNYDQALLALNIISHLGSEWERTGLVRKYKPFANVPEKFFNFDHSFHIKKRFPNVAFEWEGQRGARPIYRNLTIRRWTLTLETRAK